MPELAEVEYYRKQWDCGVGHHVRAVRLHPRARLFRDGTGPVLETALPGQRLLASEASGKQMLFRFSGGLCLGVHLGMTGQLRREAATFQPARHDHLVLQQARQALVFSDPRQFGRVRFHSGPHEPDWWSRLPPPLTGPAFTAQVMEAFLQRHRRLPIKAALLLQTGFPGLGNWMADEILWRARVNPHTPAGHLRGATLRQVWKTTRFVCRTALRVIGHDFSDPPNGWLMNEKWKRHGVCPLHRTRLKKEILGGRTTAWCPECQVQRG